MQISQGPTYAVKVTGMSVQPGLQFSTTSHNFGVCFLSQPDMPVPSMLLTLTNTDNKDIRFINYYHIYSYCWWWFGVVVMSLGTSNKLLYAWPG